VILLLGMNFYRNLSHYDNNPELEIPLKFFKCSLKTFRCSCILPLANNQKLPGWSNGMSLEFWEKPRSSHNKASQMFNLRNGCTRQHFGTKLYFKSSYLTFHFPFSLHIWSVITNFYFCSLNLKHSSSTMP
jgi:hypothetical protein